MSTIVHSGLPRQTLPFGSTISFEKGSCGNAIADDGTEFVDFVLGYGSVAVGHATEQFLTQLNLYNRYGLHLPGYTTWHYKLADLILDDYTSASLAFFKTGSESVTAAIRLSSLLTQRRGVLRCGFIGWHDALLAQSVRWHEPLHSPLRNALRFTEGFRGVSGDEQVYNWVSLDLDELETILADHGSKIACFILDTYQLHFSNPEAIATALRLCKARGLVVVLDETKIAGRVSRLGFGHFYDWSADLTILGKALANGAPLSILFGSRDIMQQSEAARITGTFSQELSAVFSALATDEIMSRQNGYSLLKQTGTRLVAVINAAARAARVEDDIQALAVFGGAMFEFAFSPATIGDWSIRSAVCSFMAEEGILVLQGHPSYVCLAHAQLNWEELEAKITKSLRKWKGVLLSETRQPL
jgi:glutamate-1-semialdehyde 2,1-aminomutase